MFLNIQSPAWETLAQWAVLNIWPFFIGFQFSVCCTNAFHTISWRTHGFGFNICVVLKMLLVKNGQRIMLPFIKTASHELISLLAIRKGSCFLRLMRRVTELFEPPVSGWTARQYHGRFNTAAVFLERIVALNSYLKKKRCQTQRSQNSSTQKRNCFAQEFIGLFEFIASICWGIFTVVRTLCVRTHECVSRRG